MSLPLIGAQDHKRAFDGDKGPNTGGMGAYSPAPIFDAAMQKRTMDEIILPTVRAMAEAGMPFKGVLYAGLMITAQGPKIFEYNCRFGDPECQVLMMRLKSDIVPALIACADGGLKTFRPALVERHGADRGHGGQGLSRMPTRRAARSAASTPRPRSRACRFSMPAPKPDGKRVLANGGRVLNVTAMAPTVEEARNRAYRAVDLIDWPEGFCRRDIAWRAVARQP